MLNWVAKRYQTCLNEENVSQIWSNVWLLNNAFEIHKQKAKNNDIMFQWFGDLMTPLSGINKFCFIHVQVGCWNTHKKNQQYEREILVHQTHGKKVQMSFSKSKQQVCSLHLVIEVFYFSSFGSTDDSVHKAICVIYDARRTQTCKA